MKYERNWGQLGMKSEWKIETLADVCKVVTDGSHYSPHSVQKGKYMVSVKDFTEYGFDFSQCRQISEQDYEKLQKGGCVPEYQDILVGKDGVRYFEDIILYRQDERPALLSSIAILRCDESKIMPEFLYYLLKMPSVQKNVKENYGSGSAIPRIVLKDFRRMPVQYPDIKTQEAIVSILQCIDEKIQVNLRINKNLEHQAEAIFQSILSNAITTVNLGKIADVKGGKRLPKGVNLIDIPNTHPYIRVRDLNNVLFASLTPDYAYVDEETQKSISRYIVSTGDVLISIVGTIGLTAIVDSTLDKANLTENCVKVTNLKHITPEYLLLYLRSQSGREAITKGTVGAVQQKLPIKNIQAIPIPLLSERDKTTLFCTLDSIFDEISSNVIQSTKLVSLRDTLLPKLMSCELDVSAIDL